MWGLDQTSGSTATDTSGNGHTAAVTSAKWTGTAARFPATAGQQIATNSTVFSTTASYSVSAWADLAAAPTANEAVVSQDSSVYYGFALQYNSTDKSWSFGIPTSDVSGAATTRAHGSAAPTAGTWYHLVGTYDASTGAMTLYVNGSSAGTATDKSPITSTGAFAIGRDQLSGKPAELFNGSIANVQVYQRVLSPSEVSGLYTSGQNGNAVGSSAWSGTTWQHDVRGLPISKTDGNGNMTRYDYDEAGQLSVTTGPAVTSEAYGQSATTVNPTSVIGYNAFGERTETQDANGYISTSVYDANGNEVSQTQPNYTPPGSSTPIAATTGWKYDNQNQLTGETDPLNRTTSYLYDQLGNVALVTRPDGGTVHSTYDGDGDELSETGATGAQTQWTYDSMGRQLTETTLERYPTAQTLTTTNSYAASATNPGGANLARQTSPSGTYTAHGYDALGEQTSSTDATGDTESTSYNFMGLPQRTTEPDGTYREITYDALENPTTGRNYDASGNVLSTESMRYDGDGNLVSSQNPRGYTTTFSYDTSGMLTRQVEPVSATSSITTSYGYDADGQPTRYTDGRGNNWYTTYNSWGLKASQVEPTTATYSSAADSTTTYAYDADARLTSMTKPGGVTESFAYDSLGNILTESGSGASAATGTRTFTYDMDGQIKTATTASAGSAAATSESFSYDDRGDLLSASGSAGSSSFAYNSDGLMSARTDASGTTSYTYDTNDRLSSAVDAATGTSVNYGYNTLSQVTAIAYGTGQNTRSFSYDSLHRLISDTVQTASGATVTSIGYGYDANGNLSSKTTSGFGASTSNSYTYDYADRLTSWNNGTSTVAYGYDAAGNRTQVGSNVYTYDARDQLTGDGTNTYTYTAAGVMATQNNTAYTSDAFAQVTTAGTLAYTYDALGRVVSRTNSSGATTNSLQYSGATNDVSTDGSYAYSRDPDGGLLGVKTAGGATSTGRLALTDQHTDVVGSFTATGTTLTGSAAYDPLGNVIGTSTKLGNLGYQSQYTDPTSGEVNMLSRWYNPGTGEFISKDDASPSASPESAAANPFAYIGDNPMIGTDPGGDCSWYNVACHAKAVYHAVVAPVYHAAVHVYKRYVAPKVKAVVHAARKLGHKISDGYHKAKSWVKHTYHRITRSIGHGLRRLGHAIGHGLRKAWHAVAKGGRALWHGAKAVGHAFKKGIKAVGHGLKAAGKGIVKGLKATKKFVQHHAAAITSIVVSTIVFSGCEAALGAISFGVGAVAGAVGCGALAGAAGGLVSQGFKCANSSGADKSKNCSASSFVKTGLEQGALGGLTGAAGPLGGKLLEDVAPEGVEAVGGLFGGEGAGAGESAVDAAAAGGTRGARAARGAEEETGNSPENPKAGRDDPAETCSVLHSFTASTPVLMSDGSTRPISDVKVGDTIENSIPGQSGTQTNTVDNVIVTTTDHDFVDVSVAPAADPSARTNSLLGRAGKALAAGTTAAVLATSGVAGPGIDAPVVHGATLSTTFHHPFYDETRSTFVDAQDLQVGDLLQTPTGSAYVTGVRLYHTTEVTYDLTIGGLHTYYVVAGDAAVLVHNCAAKKPSWTARAKARAQQWHENNQHRIENGFHTANQWQDVVNNSLDNLAPAMGHNGAVVGPAARVIAGVAGFVKGFSEGGRPEIEP
jgi:RHS repeat-associated protein